jgi:hypothetical protein
MTSVPPSNDVESRLTRLENLMSSAGEMLVQTSTLAQRNAIDFESVREAFESAREVLIRASAVAERNALDIEALTEDIRRNAADIRAMSRRVDSLAAASERHDRILDYLLRREAGDIETE